MHRDEYASRRTALTTLRGAHGWIDWNLGRNLPNWADGRVALDGRFSVDELLALLVLANHPGRANH